ncbi:hypothetical protein [Nostoc sp. GT001]|uniref:hypothetical protein n=1 Tax=Nostoc sp. GT001 TaxID=3056647 RepID=UPI0025AAF7D2|nr:hypothetical protein [Nostoc sp. GT001]MDM9582620.1 hypothetical protein [Nostoc sp. GT001]
MTSEEAAEIETEVLRPYQERLENLQTYREALIAEVDHEYPLSEEACKEMNMLQELLGLKDDNILPIKQQIEAQFVCQACKGSREVRKRVRTPFGSFTEVSICPNCKDSEKLA